MSSTIPAASQPVFPTEVAAFAAEYGVADYLSAVLERTRRVFPTAQRITALVEDDPEIADDRHIVFEVEVAGLDVSQSVDLHWQWSRELFHVCPAAQVCLFGLHLNGGGA